MGGVHASLKRAAHDTVTSGHGGLAVDALDGVLECLFVRLTGGDYLSLTQFHSPAGVEKTDRPLTSWTAPNQWSAGSVPRRSKGPTWSNPRRAHFLLVRRRLDVLRLWRRSARRVLGAFVTRVRTVGVGNRQWVKTLVAPNAIAAQYCFDLQVPLLELSFTELQVRAVQRVAVELIARRRAYHEARFETSR